MCVWGGGGGGVGSGGRAPALVRGGYNYHGLPPPPPFRAKLCCIECLAELSDNPAFLKALARRKQSDPHFFAS